MEARGRPTAATSVTATCCIKSVTLSWEAVSGAAYYRVYKDPEGVSGFSQIGGDQASTIYSGSRALHLTDWVKVRYRVTAYISAGNTDSNIVTGLDLLQAIGYFKASNGPLTHGNHGGQFGASVALSPGGDALAVGGLLEDSDSVGVNGDQLGVTEGFNASAVYVFTHAAVV